MRVRSVILRLRRIRAAMSNENYDDQIEGEQIEGEPDQPGAAYHSGVTLFARTVERPIQLSENQQNMIVRWSSIDVSSYIAFTDCSGLPITVEMQKQAATAMNLKFLASGGFSTRAQQNAMQVLTDSGYAHNTLFIRYKKRILEMMLAAGRESRMAQIAFYSVVATYIIEKLRATLQLPTTLIGVSHGGGVMCMIAELTGCDTLVLQSPDYPFGYATRHIPRSYLMWDPEDHVIPPGQYDVNSHYMHVTRDLNARTNSLKHKATSAGHAFCSTTLRELYFDLKF